MVDFRIFVEHLGLDLDILDLGPTFLIVASFSPASSSTILRNFQGRCGTTGLNIFSYFSEVSGFVFSTRLFFTPDSKLQDISFHH